MDETRILIISKQPEDILPLQEAILAPAGCKSAIVASAQEAVEKTQLAPQSAEQPDLIFLHLTAPADIRLLEELQQKGVGLPIVLLLPESFRSVPTEALQFGVQGCLSLPTGSSQVRLVVEKSLRDAHLREEQALLQRKLQEASQELERRSLTLTTLYGLGRSLATILDTETLVNQVLEAAIHLVTADEVTMLIADRGGKGFSFQATRSVIGNAGGTTRLRVEDSLAEMVMQTGQPLVTANAGGTVARESLLRGSLIRSLLDVPLKVWDRPIGVLSAVNKITDYAFTDDDRLLLSVLADYAAIALENARARDDSRNAAAMGMLRQTVATLSHYINNPLTALVAGIHTIASGLKESTHTYAGNQTNQQASALQALQVIELKAKEIATVISVLQEIVVPTSTQYWREEKMLDIEKRLKERLQSLNRAPKDGST